MPYQETARKILKKHGFKKTKQRKEIIEILDNSKDSLSFSDIVKKSLGSGLNEVTVYRFLHTLEDLHLVKKISSLHRYLKCEGGEHLHNHYFLVCSDCQSVSEKVINENEKIVAGLDIYPHHQSIEIVGKCKTCNES